MLTWPLGSGADKATWNFTGLEDGYYEVSVKWMVASNRATNAPCKVFDNTTQVTSVNVN